MKMKFSHLFLILYVIVFSVCSISPYSRTVWFAENLPILVLVATIILISRHYQFSNFSILLMGVLPILHTIGGHYTFERVPFGFVTELFGFERNHYDRIAHFSVGFYAFPIAEYLLAKRHVTSRELACLFGILAVFTVASIYEIIEWQYAIFADPDSGIAVLGSQGDIWDAQKDMLADGLGAILVSIIFYFWSGRKMNIQSSEQ